MAAASTRLPTVAELAPGVTRVVAPNPGMMTGPGTNSYVIGTGPCVIVDPAVEDRDHLDRLAAAVKGEPLAIVVTHAHPDHTGGARRLARRFGIDILAEPHRLKGVRDPVFRADRPLRGGEVLRLGDITLDVLHTPGHAVDHLCLLWRERGWLFAGDTVMADVTVVIAPPDGDMSDYFTTLARLQALPLTQIAPGHGRLLDDAPKVLADIVAHRERREDEVLAALRPRGPTTAASLVGSLYPTLDTFMRPMAVAQIESHLIRLGETGRARNQAGSWRAVDRSD